MRADPVAIAVIYNNILDQTIYKVNSAHCMSWMVSPIKTYFLKAANGRCRRLFLLTYSKRMKKVRCPILDHLAMAVLCHQTGQSTWSSMYLSFLRLTALTPYGERQRSLLYLTYVEVMKWAAISSGWVWWYWCAFMVNDVPVYTSYLTFSL